MPEKKPDCAFCQPDDSMKNLIVNRGDGFISFFSKPRFRRNHLLVVPDEHYTVASKMGAALLGRIVYEAESLADVVDFGYGSVVTQKSQPLQKENGIKMDHVHFHVWPRTKQDEKNGVVIPAPQSFDDFFIPSNEAEMKELDDDIQRNKREFEMLFLRKKGMPWHDIWALLENNRDGQPS
ncbi:MAG: HIT domain-containing protein [Candidatus Nomurabacteria bacterium]|nr:MAG: HIT domain-containing protein [Candidatus Nomurabacteria bacterium]